jgi:hypothetical protein
VRIQKLILPAAAMLKYMASKSLDVDIAGAGDVRYKGNPSVKQNIAGSGDVRKVD